MGLRIYGIDHSAEALFVRGFQMELFSKNR